MVIFPSKNSKIHLKESLYGNQAIKVFLKGLETNYYVRKEESEL